MSKDPLMTNMPIIERFRLRGKTALITGAGQGIGRAYAHALGEAGARIAVVDINPDKAECVVEELQEKGVRAMAIMSNCTDKNDIHQMVDLVVKEWGSLTIGVNNAGICLWGDAEQMSEEVWDKQMNLNLRGAFYCAQAEARAMMKQGYGKIINTASISGRIVNFPQHQCAYNASKAGLIHLTKSLAVEWAEKGIRVNSISPTYTKTELVDELIESDEGKIMMRKWIQMTPMGRMAEVTDLQGAVVFLASEASDFITGHDIVIDGGYCSI